jgi:mitochondrial fission protein ELM1
VNGITTILNFVQRHNAILDFNNADTDEQTCSALFVNFARIVQITRNTVELRLSEAQSTGLPVIRIDVAIVLRFKWN